MREPAFLKRNKEKWKGFEDKIRDIDNMSPDEQAEIFIELTDDLAYSQTYYPNSQTTRYVNNMAVKVHQSIYKNKKERSGRILDFWKYELPSMFYKHLPKLFTAFVVFGVAIVIGIISTLNDATFVRLILGDQYVNMTLENIQNGDPMAVYGQMDEFSMFTYITLNNIWVSILAMVLGLFFSLGTGYVLFQNGIMVGAFFTFLFNEGVGKTAFSAVMIHGTLELTAITIAGCAGFVIGNSILFPGTYTRIQSFMKGAREAIKISVGLVPIFVVAGFLESFVTRHYQTHWIINWAIIIISAIFLVWYFVLYPIQLNRSISDD